MSNNDFDRYFESDPTDELLPGDTVLYRAPVSSPPPRFRSIFVAVALLLTHEIEARAARRHFVPRPGCRHR